MPRSLLRTINSLAKYEDTDTPLFTRFLLVRYPRSLTGKSIALIKAADRLIGYLFSYGQEISIGDRYFQPCFYRTKRQTVRFYWSEQNKRSFCAGCRYDCRCYTNMFSSACLRFRIAWAVEHVIANTNRLMQLVSRKENPND